MSTTNAKDTQQRVVNPYRIMEVPTSVQNIIEVQEENSAPISRRVNEERFTIIRSNEELTTDSETTDNETTDDERLSSASQSFSPVRPSPPNNFEVIDDCIVNESLTTQDGDVTMDLGPPPPYSNIDSNTPYPSMLANTPAYTHSTLHPSGTYTRSTNQTIKTAPAPSSYNNTSTGSTYQPLTAYDKEIQRSFRDRVTCLTQSDARGPFAQLYGSFYSSGGRVINTTAFNFLEQLVTFLEMNVDSLDSSVTSVLPHLLQAITNCIPDFEIPFIENYCWNGEGFYSRIRALDLLADLDHGLGVRSVTGYRENEVYTPVQLPVLTPATQPVTEGIIDESASKLRHSVMDADQEEEAKEFLRFLAEGEENYDDDNDDKENTTDGSQSDSSVGIKWKKYKSSKAKNEGKKHRRNAATEKVGGSSTDESTTEESDFELCSAVKSDDELFTRYRESKASATDEESESAANNLGSDFEEVGIDSSDDSVAIESDATESTEDWNHVTRIY